MIVLLVEPTRDITRKLKVWNYEVIRNIFRRKHHLLTCHSGIQYALENGHNPFLVELEQQLRKEFDRVLPQEEVLWYQESHYKWDLLRKESTIF